MPFPCDYKERATTLGFAAPEEVKKALENPNTIVIDVRSEEEVKATEKLPVPNLKTTGCHACPHMDGLVDKWVSDKNATIVVFCKSGRRANVAKERLHGMGYANVLNAGGLEDVLAILHQV